MYYITKKDTETGKKFQALKEKIDVIYDSQLALAKEYGFSHFINKPFCVIGVIRCVAFEDKTQFNPKFWKFFREQNGQKFYIPKLKNPIGKEIQWNFDTLDKVLYSDVNACIGFDSSCYHIGFNLNNDTYFGFTAEEEWEVEVPADCEEITFTKWKEIFKEE